MSQVRNQSDAPSRTLEELIALPYRLEIIPGQHNEGLVVRYPELPGCITQVETWDEVLPAAEEILEGWLAIALEDGQDIPMPRQTEDYSGRFLIRITKSLHRELAETAAAEGVSLNAYVTTLLASGHLRHEPRRQVEEIAASQARPNSRR